MQFLLLSIADCFVYILASVDSEIGLHYEEQELACVCLHRCLIRFVDFNLDNHWWNFEDYHKIREFHVLNLSAIYLTRAPIDHHRAEKLNPTEHIVC